MKMCGSMHRKCIESEDAVESIFIFLVFKSVDRCDIV